MSRGSLLDYAEALRTGSHLKDARKWRARLKAQHPVSIWALEEEMPQEHVEAVKSYVCPPREHKPRAPRKPRKPRNRRRNARARQAQARPTPIRPGEMPATGAQLRELRRLAEKLQRRPPKVGTKSAAHAAIVQLRQVCEVTLGRH